MMSSRRDMRKYARRAWWLRDVGIDANSSAELAYYRKEFGLRGSDNKVPKRKFGRRRVTLKSEYDDACRVLRKGNETT